MQIKIGNIWQKATKIFMQNLKTDLAELSEIYFK